MKWLNVYAHGVSGASPGDLATQINEVMAVNTPEPGECVVILPIPLLPDDPEQPNDLCGVLILIG